jgi:hypothetical protein
MKILVGSTYFFKQYSDFHSKDIDYVELVDNPIEFNYNKHIYENNVCLFKWRRMSADKFVEYSLTKGPSMQIGKFLVKEFNEEIQFSIEHLKRLQPLIERLDDKHNYQKIIFHAYIDNNSFTLTDEQREEAYKMYKKVRL